MPLRVKIVAFVFSVGMMLLIVELVRRRKLREEYSWLWLLTGSVIVVLLMWFDLLKWITHLMGAIVPSSALFFLAFLFLILVSLHFSVVISKLQDRNKDLAQRYALLEMELRELRKRIPLSDENLEEGANRRIIPEQRATHPPSPEKE
jgi:hypothetical protein